MAQLRLNMKQDEFDSIVSRVQAFLRSPKRDPKAEDRIDPSLFPEKEARVALERFVNLPKPYRDPLRVMQCLQQSGVAARLENEKKGSWTVLTFLLSSVCRDKKSKKYLTAWPSLQTIAECVGRSSRDVETILNYLANKGMPFVIIKHTIHRRYKGWSNNLYYLNPDVFRLFIIHAFQKMNKLKLQVTSKLKLKWGNHDSEHDNIEQAIEIAEDRGFWYNKKFREKGPSWLKEKILGWKSVTEVIQFARNRSEKYSDNNRLASNILLTYTNKLVLVH
jgi:hypothetical protein